MSYPAFSIQNDRECMNGKPILTSLSRKDGLVLINGRNLIEILENSTSNIEIVRKTFVKICVSPNFAVAAVELKKEGLAPLEIITGFSAVFNLTRTEARLLFDAFCYPAIVDWIESEFNNKLNNKIVALRELAATRSLAEAEQLELSIFERLQATDDIDVVRGIRSEVQAMDIDPTLQKNLLQMIGEKRDLC